MCNLFLSHLNPSPSDAMTIRAATHQQVVVFVLKYARCKVPQLHLLQLAVQVLVLHLNFAGTLQPATTAGGSGVCRCAGGRGRQVKPMEWSSSGSSP